MKNPPEFTGKNKEIIEDYIRYAVLAGKEREVNSWGTVEIKGIC